MQTFSQFDIKRQPEMSKYGNYGKQKMSNSGYHGNVSG